MLNLIQNASQVTPKGYTVSVNAVVHEDKVLLCVNDKGPGVPNTLINKIFEPFFTTKTHGTGLGLAVVKSVAKAHNGSLSVVNLNEGGACFTLALPCNTQAIGQHNKPHSNVA